MATQSLVPFGKYKGQPLEVIGQDRGYCEWLLTQAWFVERFPQIHTVVINNFGEPADTPEHNALQLRLLDEGFRAKCTALALQFFSPQRAWRHEVLEGDAGSLMYLSTPSFSFAAAPTFEEAGIDVAWQVKQWSLVHNTRQPPLDSTTLGRLPDAHTTRWIEAPSCRLAVECKPVIGDDFPAILRFLKNLPDKLNGACRVVLAGDVRSQTVPLAAIKAFFATSHVALLLVADVEATEPDGWGPGCPSQDVAHGVYMLPRANESLRCAQCVAVPGHATPYAAPLRASRLFDILRHNLHVKWQQARAEEWQRWDTLRRHCFDVRTSLLDLDAQCFVLKIANPAIRETLQQAACIADLERAVHEILGYALKVEIRDVDAAD
jgi:hypothetical protein